MRELSASEAIEMMKLEADAKEDRELAYGIVAALKEIVVKQAIMYHDKSPILRFFEMDNGKVAIEVDGASIQLIREL